MASGPPLNFEVDLPAGGRLQLRTQEECQLWEELHDKYVKEYGLSKANDLAMMGAILSQHLALFRAQQKMNGMVVETDASGVPTGRYKIDASTKPADLSSAQNAITKASEEIRHMEKALGIDKKTREAGGLFNVQDYLKNLKRAAHMMGVHIQKRLFMYEEFNKQLSWMIRLLDNGDDEDRLVHDISEEKIVAFCRRELARIENEEKQYAKRAGQVYTGKL